MQVIFVRHASGRFVSFYNPPVVSLCYQDAPELSILFHVADCES